MYFTNKRHKEKDDLTGTKASNDLRTTKNQSVENTGVAFVKGANERNEFFEKINKK